MTTTNHPAGVITLLHTVRAAVSHINGLTVEAYARGVIVATRPNDPRGTSRINRAHAALRVSNVAPTHIKRQGPTVLKIVAPRVRKPGKGKRNP